MFTGHNKGKADVQQVHQAARESGQPQQTLRREGSTEDRKAEHDCAGDGDTRPRSLGLLVGGRKRVGSPGGRVHRGEHTGDRSADGEYPVNDVNDRLNQVKGRVVHLLRVRANGTTSSTRRQIGRIKGGFLAV